MMRLEGNQLKSVHTIITAIYTSVNNRLERFQGYISAVEGTMGLFEFMRQPPLSHLAMKAMSNAEVTYLILDGTGKHCT